MYTIVQVWNIHADKFIASWISADWLVSGNKSTQNIQRHVGWMFLHGIVLFSLLIRFYSMQVSDKVWYDERLLSNLNFWLQMKLSNFSNDIYHNEGSFLASKIVSFRLNWNIWPMSSVHHFLSRRCEQTITVECLFFFRSLLL